jgi:hypothetical protein
LVSRLSVGRRFRLIRNGRVVDRSESPKRKPVMELSFQIVVRKGAGQFRVLVFDRMKRLHFPLTVFAAEAVKRSSDSTARVYLNAVIPFLEWLERDESQCGAGRSWDDSPEAIRQGVGDYLVERLKCKVRELSQRQEVLLQKHFQQVTLMLDGDTAGRRAAAIIAARLVTKLAVRVVEIPLGSQPDQLGADQIRCLCDPDFF